MLHAQSKNTVKPEWFGKKINVLLSNGKQIAGELNEAGQNYLILQTEDGEMQVMVNAVILIRPSEPVE